MQFTDRHGNAVSPQQVRAMLDRKAPKTDTKTPTATRKAITDALGLPKTATNEQVFAAVDAVKARKATAASPALEDALYERVMGHAGAPTAGPVELSDDALYEKVIGR